MTILFLLSSVVCFSSKLLMATTTSLYNTGLLDVLKTEFEKRYKHSLTILAVGSGMALEMGRKGLVDLLFVHSPEDEELFMKQGFGEKRVSIMQNEFIVVGPTEFDISYKGLEDLFSQIVERRFLFVSRGDESGTHRMEMKIWSQIGKKPDSKSYISTGQGMATTLLIANEKRAFTLTDRATYEFLKSKLNMKIFIEGDPRLKNVYSVIVVSPKTGKRVNYPVAMEFLEFITSKEALNLIENFSINGVKLFEVIAQPSGDSVERNSGDQP
ncbi:substrate-binding domain-containing protein [Pseudothermotoga thermarum]|uniref:substrate-binding domain-containing protein n=1 Tax=Pseudothermotoga thermarum TaxID=119394 RepID=UPI001FE13DC6|nr:substrate-binding domain-containing protein [Pseudothermotoga thermarum]